MKLYKVTWTDSVYGVYEKWQESLTDAERYVEVLSGWWKEAEDISFCAVDVPIYGKALMCHWLNENCAASGKK